jgi:hypothetical protein
MILDKFAPLPGYPWKRRFNSLEEINAYMNQDRLTCLLCGHNYASLTNHLIRRHHIHPDRYKERYCITYKTRLAGKTWRAKARKLFFQKVRQGKLKLGPPKRHIRKILRLKKRPLNAAVRQTARTRLLKRLGRDRTWNDADFKEYLKRIKSGRTISEVGRDKDMPNRDMFFKRLREDKKFRTTFEHIWEHLPFAVQACGQKLGKRFDQAIIRLRREGHNWKDIGKILECSPSTPRTRWRWLARQGQVSPKEFRHGVGWTDTHFTEFLIRVQAGRTPAEVARDTDMPSIQRFHAHLQKDRKFCQRFRKVWENLPFFVQARGHRLGKRFLRTVIASRRRGLTWSEIDRIAGTKDTARSTWSRWKRRVKN